MKKYLLFFFLICLAGYLPAQTGVETKPTFTVVKLNAATPVKNQAATGTCWSFSTTSLVESQALKSNAGEIDLSEMFTVRNIYIEKAKNYVMRLGRAQFGEGGLGHDQIHAIATYGAMPESAYSGLTGGQKSHNHSKLFTALKTYLDNLIKTTPLAENWIAGYIDILDAALGKAPAEFEYKGKTYTPKTFAQEVLKFDANDYVALTSFTHHPFYEPFILETMDNFSNGSFYNLPLYELIQLTKDALNSGYTLMWDADVSNKGFNQKMGMAVYVEDNDKANIQDIVSGVSEEGAVNPVIRQQLFENLTTQDDHLMHIIGLETDKKGESFFVVKNSWGEVGPDKGYINVSEPYFAINTISLVVPKAAISKSLLEKLKIK
ncbi:MAG: C1 family peptidase [Ferruginibacter sp.]